MVFLGFYYLGNGWDTDSRFHKSSGVIESIVRSDRGCMTELCPCLNVSICLPLPLFNNSSSIAFPTAFLEIEISVLEVSLHSATHIAENAFHTKSTNIRVIHSQSERDYICGSTTTARDQRS